MVQYIPKSVNVIHHTSRLKNRNNIPISLDAEKACNKIKQPYMMKGLDDLGYKALLT